ncbi:T9SS type A sorting domain-containing protein [bacterium]|nr:T9SS type A sorting domain-containing protein [bacterium]
MRRFLFIAITFLFCAQIAPAQTDPSLVGNCEPSTAEAYLDVGNVRARLLNTGTLFYRGSPSVYEVPKGSGLHSVFGTSLWIGGLVDDEIRAAATLFGPHEFWPGPIATPGVPPEQCKDYDSIFTIDREQDLDPLEDGFISPRVKEWPAHLGAPFKDVNGVLGYQPEEGDVPVILGDQMHWWVMNDAGNVHGLSRSNPLGIEMRVSAFAFKRPHGLENVTFYRYEVTNKSLKIIEKAHIGHFVDADLGAAFDDRFGSDSTLSMIYFYNADNDDDGQYGPAPPALGVAIIQASHSRGGLPSDFSGTRSGEFMTSAKHEATGGGVTGDPSSASDFYYYLSGRWKDGKGFTEGGYGRGTSTKPSPMMWTGDPVIGAFWSEVNTDGAGGTIPPQDRRGTGSFGPFELEPEDTATFTFAYVWARGENNLDSISKLRRLTQAVHETSSIILQPRQEPIKFVDGNLPERPQQSFWLDPPFPNPGNGPITIKFSLSLDGPTEIEVYDVLSRKVASILGGFQQAGRHEASFDTSDLRPGVYTIRLQSNRNSTSRQLTVIR